MTRRLVRTALAVGILLFAWYAISAVASHAAGSLVLVTVAAALLLLLWFALGRQRA
jgi:predicted secreted protein